MRRSIHVGCTWCMPWIAIRWLRQSSKSNKKTMQLFKKTTTLTQRNKKAHTFILYHMQKKPDPGHFPTFGDGISRSQVFKVLLPTLPRIVRNNGLHDFPCRRNLSSRGGGDLGCIFDGEMHAEISEASLFNALGVSLVAHDIMNPLWSVLGQVMWSYPFIFGHFVGVITRLQLVGAHLEHCTLHHRTPLQPRHAARILSADFLRSTAFCFSSAAGGD